MRESLLPGFFCPWAMNVLNIEHMKLFFLLLTDQQNAGMKGVTFFSGAGHTPANRRVRGGETQRLIE